MSECPDCEGESIEGRGCRTCNSTGQVPDSPENKCPGDFIGDDRRKREDFTKQQAELDRKYEALPAPLKARIDRFRAADPKFRMDAEAYEMAAVWDAPKIAEALRPEVEAGEDPEVVVNRFRDLSFEEQNAKVPGLDQGHSGNTFGGAVMLAYRLLAGLEC